METAKRVQILLSTYNGEKYLREQLDSYAAQTCFEQVKVLIRDDGSRDGSPQILNEYARRYGFEVILGENVGVNASYEELLRESDPNCRYFAFSDQDDVWLPDKLELAMSRLDPLEADRPAMFFSLSQVTDEALGPIAVSHAPSRGLSFYNAMVQNVCPGHTQVMNGAMRELMLRSDCSRVHVMDWWSYLLASGLGDMIYEPRCTVLHRQHGGNAVGYEFNALKKLAMRLRRVRSKEAAAITRQLEHFRQSFGQQLPKEYREELSAFLDSQASVFSRFSYACSARIFRQTKMETVLVRLLYLLGKYRLKDG